MVTLEDKILGEKLHNYCSSSEESDGENSDVEENINLQSKQQQLSHSEDFTQPQPNKWEGTSTNTGPKGVMKDWQRFKQLEIQKRESEELERINLAKKLTLTVQTALDEEREKLAEEDPELAEIFNDEFLLSYQKQRMQEMLLRNENKQTFGKLLFLKNGKDYLNAIDKENKHVTVVIHIYEGHVESCHLMNTCLSELSSVYVNVKFCAIVSSVAGMSRHFKVNGVPALLIYKNGQLVGNFVRISDDLGYNFCAEDVQGYLVEHGMIEDKSCIPLLIRNTADCNTDDD